MSTAPTTRCPHCSSKDTARVLRGPMRRQARKHFGGRTHLNIDICQNCTFVFVAPRPSDQELHAFYEKSDRVTTPAEVIQRSLDGQSAFRQSVLEFIETSAPLPKAPRILDIGTGYGGLLADALAKWNGTGLGTEFSDAARDFAQSHMGLTVQDKPLDQLSDLNSTNDLIMCSAVLEHMNAPLEELRRMHQLLKPGGYAFILVPDVEAITLNPLAGGRMQTVFKIVHLNYFSSQTLVHMGQSAGFAPVAFKRGARNPRQAEIWALFQKTDMDDMAKPALAPPDWRGVRKNIRSASRAARVFSQIEQVGLRVFGDKAAARILKRLRRAR